MHHAFKLGDVEHNAELSRGGSGYRLHMAEGKSVAFDLRTGAGGRDWLTIDGEHHEVVIAVRGDDVFVHFQGEAHALRHEHPLVRLAAQAHGSADDQVRAPMPGAIVSIAVKAGDAVTKGQTLLVMESMKMETTLAAPRDGVVEAVHFAKGQTFDRDALLLNLVAGDRK